MKKVAVIKLGSRITYGGTSGGSGEAMAIIDMLVKGDCEVTAFTKILDKDKPIPNVKVLDIIDNVDSITKDNFDHLVVLNGSVNYFGGAEDAHQIYNYKAMTTYSNSSGIPNYIYCDPNLMLRETWPSVEKKEWGTKYKQSEIELGDIEINYISQPKDTSIIEKIRTTSNLNITNMTHYELEKFPLLDPNVYNVKLSEKTYDILYGGTFRGGKRELDMIKFYFGTGATMFGNIKESNFSDKKIEKMGKTRDEMPNFEKAVKYDEFNSKMSNAICTIIIGDEYYKKIDDLAQRIYESIQAGVVTFIDEDYDRTKRVFSDERLASFLYVKDSDDVMRKLEKVKSWSDEQYQAFINFQRESTTLSPNYCKDFVDLLKN